MQDDPQPLAALRADRMANGSALRRMACLARVMRRVMVASGTRNARAISPVVRPPTARKARAICDEAEIAG